MAASFTDEEVLLHHIALFRGCENYELKMTMRKDILNKFYIPNGFSLETRIFQPLTPQQKHLIRFEAYGYLPEVDDSKLSKTYKRALQTSKYENRIYRLNDYNLDKSPDWQLFRQRPSFRQIEPYLIAALRRKRLNPKSVQNFRFNDFQQLLAANCASVLKKLSAKQYAMKKIATDLEPQIRQDLLNQNVDPLYVEALLTSMKEKGSGENISVRDSSGRKLRIKGPEFEMDHTRNALTGGDDINHISNFCLVRKDLHRPLFHCFDLTSKIDGMSFRIESLKRPEHMVYCSGLEKEHQLYKDYSRDNGQEKILPPIAFNEINPNKKHRTYSTSAYYNYNGRSNGARR